MRKTMFILVTLALILTACLPGQSPGDVQSQINTAVAQTIEARQQVEDSVAQTVAAQQPLSTPTAEFTETPTETPPVFPTFTPIIPTVTPLPTNSPSSSSGTSYKPSYACYIINNKPKNNTEFNKNAKFDIKWTIVNTGTKTWPSGVDIKYFSGTQLTSTNRAEISKEMKTNDTYVINLDAVAPGKKGAYTMIWALDDQICYAYLTIIVK